VKGEVEEDWATSDGLRASPVNIAAKLPEPLRKP
jgi:hypothetical protein